MNERTFRVENALKLEDPERLTWLPPADVVSSLGLRAGMTAVDIGAGTGYFAIPMAEAVNPGGKVIAVDMQRGMLDFLREKLRPPREPDNIELVQGEATRTTLPPGCADVVLLANVWHELDDHGAVLTEVKRILRGAGLLAILDWRADVAGPPGPPPDHRIPARDVVFTLEGNGWESGGISHVGRYHYLISSPGRAVRYSTIRHVL